MQLDEIVKQVLDELAQFTPSHGDIKNKLVFDDERNMYILLTVGWDDSHRYGHPLVIVEVKDNKIWIEHDGIEDGITSLLEQRGVSKDQIVFGWMSEIQRQYSGYAVS